LGEGVDPGMTLIPFPSRIGMFVLTGVNFINNLLAPLLYKNPLCSFSLTSVLKKFWDKNIVSKATHKMLMKLTTGGKLLKYIFSYIA